MLTRRSLIAGSALIPAVAWAAPASAAPGDTDAAPNPEPTEQPPIRPREDWAGSRHPVRGELLDEDAVRFLLVHHTLTPNTDTAEKIPQRLRSVYSFHTSAQRGWPDVAYNFFVDAFGTIWEGREGSIARAVRGDATGGSQGHALLCCFVGDFTAEPPTEAAMAAMTRLLAWLAHREGLDLAGPVTFTSRGSTRWRAGAEVRTEQIAAHRDMSLTECPGDALYPLVASQLLPDARALLAGPTPTPEPVPPAPEPEAARPTDPVPWVIGGAAALAGASGLAILARRARRSGAEQAKSDGGAADQQDAEEPDQES